MPSFFDFPSRESIKRACAAAKAGPESHRQSMATGLRHLQGRYVNSARAHRKWVGSIAATGARIVSISGIASAGPHAAALAAVNGISSWSSISASFASSSAKSASGRCMTALPWHRWLFSIIMYKLYNK